MEDREQTNVDDWVADSNICPCSCGSIASRGIDSAYVGPSTRKKKDQSIPEESSGEQEESSSNRGLPRLDTVLLAVVIVAILLIIARVLTATNGCTVLFDNSGLQYRGWSNGALVKDRASIPPSSSSVLQYRAFQSPPPVNTATFHVLPSRKIRFPGTDGIGKRNKTITTTNKVRSLRTQGKAVEESVKRLQELGINLLAIDFDQTIIDIHTGGRWKGTVKELRGHVRSEFRQLLVSALQHNISVAVVTFSPQVRTVRGVLDAVLGSEQSARIPIRGGDRSWSYHGAGSSDGKQAHIASAVEELQRRQQQQNSNSSRRPVKITRRTTVLIDDDRKNIRHALADGVRAVWLNPDKPHRLLGDLKRLV